MYFEIEIIIIIFSINLLIDTWLLEEQSKALHLTTYQNRIIQEEEMKSRNLLETVWRITHGSVCSFAHRGSRARCDWITETFIFSKTLNQVFKSKVEDCKLALGTSKILKLLLHYCRDDLPILTSLLSKNGGLGHC